MAEFIGPKRNKIDLSAILRGILPEREPPQLREDVNAMGLLGREMGRAPKAPTGLEEVRAIQEANKGEENFALGVLNYAMNNGEQELVENILIDLGEQLKISALTTMSGYKQDLFQKTGIIPIDGETLYQAVIEADIFGKYNLNATAIADAVGTKEILASLKYNNLGLMYDSESGQMGGEWKFEKKEGARNEETKWSLTPQISKNDIQNSEEISLAFDKAVGEGSIQLSASAKANQGGDQKTLKFNWRGSNEKDEEGKEIKGTADTIDISHLVDKSGSTFSIDGTKAIGLYDVDGKEPSFSLNYDQNLTKGDENYLATAEFPLPFDTSLYAKKGSDVGSSYGIGYDKKIPVHNIFSKNRTLDNRGILELAADVNLATGEKDASFMLRYPLSSNKLRKKPINFNNYDIQPSQMKDHVWINGELVFMPERDQFEYKQAKEYADEYKYHRGTSDIGEAYNIYKSKDWIPKDINMMSIRRADGGIAGMLGKPTYANGGRVRMASGGIADILKL